MLTIDEGMVVKAQIATAGTVVLNGRFEGNLCCTRLEIGEGGYLIGNAIAERIAVSGQVVGEIRALTIEILRNAIVEADIYHRDLSIDPDATVTGGMIRIDALDLPASMNAVQKVIQIEAAEFATAHRQFAERKATEAAARRAEFDQLRALVPRGH
jgi:cytoskeletal protein CcmA (bactofilin family)